MANLDSVLWTCLCAIKDIITEQFDRSAFGSVKEIATDDIVFSESMVDGSEYWATPGIVITWGIGPKIPVSGGNNCNSDVTYTVLLQVIDKCSGQYEDSRIRAHLAWAERLRKLFDNQNLRNTVFDDPGFVDMAYVDSVENIDIKQFRISSLCVQAIPVKIVSREKRDPKGSI